MNDNVSNKEIFIEKEERRSGNFGVIMEKRYLNITETAEYTGINVKTLYKWSRCGMIPCCKIGRILRFDKVAIDKWIRDYQKEAVNGDIL